MLKLSTTLDTFQAARTTLIISVFFGLTSRAICSISVIHFCASLMSHSEKPPVVVSSRYKTFNSDCAPLAILSTAIANRRGTFMPLDEDLMTKSFSDWKQ